MVPEYLGAVKMKRAWIITQEGPSHSTEVIGILSSRYSDKRIKEYLQWLYELLNYYPDEHLGFSRYHKPFIPYKAQENWTFHSGVLSMITCGHNPYLVARLGKNLSLIDGSILEWTEPDHVVNLLPPARETTPGDTIRVPAHLPLFSHSEPLGSGTD